MIALLMLSAGMLFAFAVATARRRRGLASASPPPMRAAAVISFIKRVNILPRLESATAFLCLIECHLECPDIKDSFVQRGLYLNIKHGWFAGIWGPPKPAPFCRQ